MYGFSPIGFDQRQPDELGVYETVEAPWLLAVWDYYAGKLEASEYKTYEITQGGVSTGTLMMNELAVDRRLQRRKGYIDLSEQIRQEIDKEILTKLMSEVQSRMVKATRIPPHYLIPDGNQMTPEGLRAHQQILKDFPSQSTSAQTLRVMGILV